MFSPARRQETASPLAALENLLRPLPPPPSRPLRLSFIHSIDNSFILLQLSFRARVLYSRRLLMDSAIATASLSSTRPQTQGRSDLTAAEAVWIATAVLHRDHPNTFDFSSQEIFKKIRELALTTHPDVTLNAHISRHCVANSAPDPNHVRMLFATARGRRRLFREGDPYHPERASHPTHPAWVNLPAPLHSLRDWYQSTWNTIQVEQDPLLAAIGIGREIWADQHADEYVAELRDWRME